MDAVGNEGPSRGDVIAVDSRGGSRIRTAALLLALRYYGRELVRHRRVAVPGLLLPALGNIGTYYVAPLIVAQLAGRLAGGASADPATVLPYVLGFAGVLLAAEVVNRVGLHGLNRADGRGIEHLYVVGMNELLAKDAAFFHENFAGSLTKRVLSFATRFEEFVDTLAFSVVANVLPLLFAVRGAVALRPAAGRGAGRADRGHGAGRGAADPAPPGPGRPAGGGRRAGVRSGGRQPAEHGDGPGVRRRGPGGRRAPRRGWPSSGCSASGPGTTGTCASTRWWHRCWCSPTRSGCCIAVGLGERRARRRGHRGDLRLLHQRQPDHVRVQPDLPAAGEFADRGRPVHRAAARHRRPCSTRAARSRCARPRPTSASSG